MVPAASDPAPPPAVRTGTRPPESLAQAIVHEYRRVFRLPFDTLLTVALNAAMMSSAWFFLPPDLVNQLFELHGSLAFAFVLSSWMYSDVPATNVLAVDAPQVLAAIDQPAALRRILSSRQVVLWTIVAPVCRSRSASGGATDGTGGRCSAAGGPWSCSPTPSCRRCPLPSWPRRSWYG